jgi:hypothetical protein
MFFAWAIFLSQILWDFSFFIFWCRTLDILRCVVVENPNPHILFVVPVDDGEALEIIL